MASEAHPPRRLIPYANPELPSDFPPPLDMWMEGECDYDDLPPENQRTARLIFKQDGDTLQHLTGKETSVRFFPGDRFAGVDRDWLIERLVLSPQYGRLRGSVYGDEELPRLTCFLDDEEVDVLDEVEDFPLGPHVNFWDNEIATVGDDSMMNMTVVGATLHEAGPWLVSVWQEVQTDYLPVPTNEMGEESEYRMTHEAWAWVAEMTAEWASVGAEQDLAIRSTVLADDFEVDEMLEHITQAAQGGRGIVSFNGTVVYQPEVSA